MPRYPLQNYAGGIMGIGMRRDFQIALLCAAAAIPAGVAMIEAPEYFPVLKAYPGTFFYGSAVITIGLLGAAVLIAIRGEREAEREGANKRMIPLVGILLFSAGFIGFALWYFWPSDWIVSGTGYLFVIAAILIIIGLDIAWIVSQLSYKPPKATPSIFVETPNEFQCLQEATILHKSLDAAEPSGDSHISNLAATVSTIDDQYLASLIAENSECIFVGRNITPGYLLSFFRDHTSIQATKLTEAYIGKWMPLHGKLGEVIYSTAYTTQVTFKSTSVFMYFHEPWIDRLTILRRGDDLMVIGQIKSIDLLSVHLDNCELRDPPIQHH
jgi:hypothetical protein